MQACVADLARFVFAFMFADAAVPHLQHHCCPQPLTCSAQEVDDAYDAFGLVQLAQSSPMHDTPHFQQHLMIVGTLVEAPHVMLLEFLLHYAAHLLKQAFTISLEN